MSAISRRPFRRPILLAVALWLSIAPIFLACNTALVLVAWCGVPFHVLRVGCKHVMDSLRMGD